MTGSKDLTPRAVAQQFASTYQEWHYFMGGVAIGFLLGAEYARRFHDG